MLQMDVIDNIKRYDKILAKIYMKLYKNYIY